jgi:ribosomal-protein-alanine N-acetyltransferase
MPNHKERVFLRSDKIFLSSLRSDDVTQAYVAWMNDTEIVQFTESRFSSHSMESIREFVQSCARDPDVILFGIFDCATELHIGNIKLGPINLRHLLGDIGIIVGRKEFWGKGIATEAISLLRDYAFSEIGLHKLTAGCYSTNFGSAKAFEKAGFQLEARRPNHFRDENGWVDILEFGCLNPKELIL